MATILIGYGSVKFDAHTHYHRQVTNNNIYGLGLLAVAMETTVVVVYGYKVHLVI